MRGFCRLGKSGSNEPIFDHAARYVCKTEVASLKAVGELLVIQPETVEHGGVQVIGMNRFFSHIPADFVGFTVDMPAFKSAPSHEH